MQETICILYTAKPLTFLPERSILAAGIVVPALPYLFSFSAGAMLYVVVEELIPEMSQGQHSNVGTVFFAVGFSVMMVLDVALGVMVGGRKRNLFRNLRKCLRQHRTIPA